MDSFILDDVLALMRAALERDDLSAAANILHNLRAPDQAELFSELTDEDQIALLPELQPTDSADILERMDEADAAELVADLPASTLIAIVDEMEPDEAADLLGDMLPDHAAQVLAGLDDRTEIQPLLLHADDSAGGLMTSSFLALRVRMTAAEALDAIRAWHPDADVSSVFVVDAQSKLCGVISLRALIIATPTDMVGDLMDPQVVSVVVGTDQEHCAHLMKRYDLFALPVIDPERRLVGVVTLDDVVDVLVDEATEDIQRMGGAQPLARAYLDNPVQHVVRSRVGWLLLLFVTESLTGTVLRHFEHELQAAVALSFFIPLLIGTGGNAGSQTTSTIIRALAVGDLALKDAGRALWHELRVGLMLGLGMAAIAYGRALTWGSSQSMAATVAVAILAIVVWANTLGSVLPLLATRLHIDPTVVSGPVMSTLVDATGLFIYFTVAHLLMGI